MIRRPRNAAALLVVAVAAALLLAAEPAAAQGQGFLPTLGGAWREGALGRWHNRYGAKFGGNKFNPLGANPVKAVCASVLRLNARNPEGHAAACSLLNIMQAILVQKTNTTCADPSATGYGSQQKLDFRSTAGVAAPVALQKVGPVPAAFSKDQLQQLLPLEGATYAWLYALIRNIAEWWPCSSGFGGSLSGFLSPAASAPGTFLPVTVASPEPDSLVTPHPGSPGVYSLQEPDLSQWDQASPPPGLFSNKGPSQKYPFFSMYVAPKPGGPRMLVIAIRGTNTRHEWLTDFAYNRVAGSPFPRAGAVKGIKTPYFEGETHAGFTELFDAVWPTIQQALLDHVIAPSSDPAAGVTGVTVTGHSLGAGVATLVAYAAQKVLNAAWTDTARFPAPPTVDLVTFGPPNVGDSAFRASLSALGVNARRIAFEYDLVPMIPCASPAGAGLEAMPACRSSISHTDVPARRGLQQEAAVESWPDYQPIFGSVAIGPSDLPVQQSAWQATELFSAARGESFKATHVCSYDCFTSAYTQGDTNNNCLLEAPAAPGFSFCPGFPVPPRPSRRPEDDEGGR